MPPSHELRRSPYLSRLTEVVLSVCVVMDLQTQSNRAGSHSQRDQLEGEPSSTDQYDDDEDVGYIREDIRGEAFGGAPGPPFGSALHVLELTKTKIRQQAALQSKRSKRQGAMLRRWHMMTPKGQLLEPKADPKLCPRLHHVTAHVPATHCMQVRRHSLRVSWS